MWCGCCAAEAAGARIVEDAASGEQGVAGNQPGSREEPAAADAPAAAARGAQASSRGVDFGGSEARFVGGDREAEPSADAATARLLFAERSATARSGLPSASRSALDLDAVAHIDPFKGLRRKESVLSIPGAVAEKYRQVGKLGEGSFGLVMQVACVDTEEQFAMKIIPVQNLKDSHRFEQELAVARRLKHPHIIRLHATFREGEAYHLVMEKSDGGDLFDRILGTRDSNASGKYAVLGLKWPQVAQYAWQMLAGVAYLHHYRFVHRDIKPENYLLHGSGAGAPLKLIDFGLARECPKNVQMTTRVGTPHYVAPEVVSDRSPGYSMKCDVWSVGVTVWFISIGTLPFQGTSQAHILKAVIKGMYDFSHERWGILQHPKELQELIASLLAKDPQGRPSGKDVVMGNQWLIQHGDPSKAVRKQPDACCSVA